MDYRVFIEKKTGFKTEEQQLRRELETYLLTDPGELRILNIYDVFNAEEYDLELLLDRVLIDPVTDRRVELPQGDAFVIALESLPGQYDQRADAAMSCLKLLGGSESVYITSGKMIVLKDRPEEELRKSILNYLINPVEKRVKNMQVLRHEEWDEVEPVPVFAGFKNLTETEVLEFKAKLGLAMSDADILHVQKYYVSEDRDPTEAEIKVLDTYWSDHCRHTTFETELTDLEIKEGKYSENIESAFEDYLELRRLTGRESKVITLMDMATIVGRHFRNIGKLDDQEISDEINACSIEVEVTEDGVPSPWLLMFKNETHNHPTEIEPYGGAGTCIGGGIRDPLSGRSYVYQAMRITGAGDITKPIAETIPNKLPQSVISRTAARGYSDYGNQIGLTQSFVDEIYDDGFVAKRMELGATVGAAPKENVVRKKPEKGDIIVLIGGNTGRDGVGGATGSSVEQTDESFEKSSSEVQKGNPTIERKILRLFRNPKATKLIKKSNDFGAGGVSVAIGELADGLDIDLDAVPVKYPGLNGTELAISESQERMALVVSPDDLDEFTKLSREEGLDVHVVAVVTDENRLVINYSGQVVVDLCRDFLNTNGIRAVQEVVINTDQISDDPFIVNSELELNESTLLSNLKSENTASQKGLARLFDATIGRSSVLVPMGGKNQITEAEASVQKLPTYGYTDDASVMSYGYNPKIAGYSPYLGAIYSVVEALARLTSVGADYRNARLSNQEFFERLGVDREKWGKPTQALLGLIEAQLRFGTPSIGGKDSMSGTYGELSVPPTLMTFAVTTMNAAKTISPEFKKFGSYVYLVKHPLKENHLPDYDALKNNFESVSSKIEDGTILSAGVIKHGGIAELISKMSMGNGIGVEVITEENPFVIMPGSLIVESTEKLDYDNFIAIGCTNETDKICINAVPISIQEAIETTLERYEQLYPTGNECVDELSTTGVCIARAGRESAVKREKPVVIIPVLPGSTGEYDAKKAFESAGAEVSTMVFSDIDSGTIQDSYEKLANEISKANILALVNGFNHGDEPDGAAKYYTNFLLEARIRKAVETMLQDGGLILGIDNGFKALLGTGLLPYGKYVDPNERVITLFKNDLEGHYSGFVNTTVTSNSSPWMSSFNPGEIHTLPISTGEGKLVADSDSIEDLLAGCQIAAQYSDESGRPISNGKYNPTGSAQGIESISSPDGRILGKMTHPERYERHLFKNIYGNKDQDIFKNGVEYFK